ncbi:MAG TPA: TraB/GumN family protein [Desulfomonilia bacterium]|nr:TraB/GumN family protein [Desulfomonilia bacterium]
MERAQRRWFIMTCSLVLSLLCLGAAAPAPVPDNKASPVFMWSVQGPKAKAFLLGSLHVFRKASYPLDARIEKAYRACPRVVLEADQGGASADEIKQKMLRMGIYQNGMTLQKAVTPTTVAKLKEHLDADGLALERFSRFKPWLASIAIATEEYKRLGYKAEFSLDSHFTREALGDKKELIFLETAGQQLDLIANAFSGREEDLLRQTLEELDVMEKSSDDIKQAWKTGDSARIESFAHRSLKDYPEIKKKLFIDRNKAWAVRISMLLEQKGDLFIVLGAGHLLGKGGVLELLKAKGFAAVQQ